jgi:pyridoxal phosphate enzyme (YggS family)
MTPTRGATHESDLRAKRKRELESNLRDVTERVQAACAQADRAAHDVQVIAVTKTFPATDVVLLVELGVVDVGENRDQEAAAKSHDVATLLSSAGDFLAANQVAPRWHFVGALQTNKCASVASYAQLVHSVDRPRLVDALGEAGVRRAAPVGCLVQVDLDDVARPGRSGARPADVPSLAASIDAHPGLTLAGVMAVAPRDAPPHRAFARLKTVADDVRQRHPYATVISAGMSNDLEHAVANGATHLRVGTALLGFRRHPVG